MGDWFQDKGIKPMLIGAEGEAFDSPEYLYELKLDGKRCTVQPGYAPYRKKLPLCEILPCKHTSILFSIVCPKAVFSCPIVRKQRTTRNCRAPHSQQALYSIWISAAFKISSPWYFGFSQSEVASLGRITGIRSWMKAMPSAALLVRTVNTGFPASRR
jgi:hypothetical protein